LGGRITGNTIREQKTDDGGMERPLNGAGVFYAGAAEQLTRDGTIIEGNIPDDVAYRQEQ